MSDFLWVLSHPTNLLTKTWKSDGTIEAYADPKQFVGTETPVNSIRELSFLLEELESELRSCVIRGKYKGHDYSKQVEPTETKPNRVLRRKSVHEDVPHHWMLVDIDNYEPFDCDPLLDPVGAINEFVKLCLPNCFHGASYHWQLSSSAGHPSKSPNKLKAHVWFWLTTPYTSSQLRTWAKSINYKGDKALFDTIQVHYTSRPVFEKGVTVPKFKRSGFEPGEFGDTVGLVIPDHILDSSPDIGSSVSRHQKITTAHSSDPIVDLLQAKHMVKSRRSDGGLNIVCPRESEHTGDSGESSTIYYPAFTGGHKEGAFVCLHEHCRGVPKSVFLEALGYDDLANVFDNLDDDYIREVTMPEALHLTTDQANAVRLVKSCKGWLLCIGERWYVWTGKYWKVCEPDALRKALNLSKLVKKEADAYYMKAGKTPSERKAKLDDFEKNKRKKDYEPDPNIAMYDTLIKWSHRCEMLTTINAAFSILKKMLSVDGLLMNRDNMLFSCCNGAIDLRTGILKKHDPADYITLYSERSYRPELDVTPWLDVVRPIMLEDKSRHTPLCDFLQRWCGYCMTGETREQVFAVFFGKGSNGKSTIVDTINRCMGDYAGTAAPDLVMSKDKSRHPTEIADLFGKRMVTAHETGEGGVLREDFIKQATGGDRMKGRYMHKDFFEFEPTHKIQLITNHKPVIKGQDDGIWRRVMLIPFLAKFGTQEQLDAGNATHLRDTRLVEKINANLDIVFTWMVQGAVRWHQEGLNPPDAVMDASKAYQTEQDRVGQFVDEVCDLGPDLVSYLTNGDNSGIYPTYVRWCKQGGMFAQTKLNFISSLERVVPGFRKSTQKINVNGRESRRRVQVIHGISCPEYFEL